MTTVFAGDLRTGEILVRAIPTIKHRVSEILHGAGVITATAGLPLRDPLTGATVNLRNIIVPARSFLAVEEGGRIVNAGPVWTDRTDFDTLQHTLRAAGVRSYYDYRYVLPALTGSQTPLDVTSTWTTSLRTQAKKLVEQAQTWTGGALPIVLEDDIAGTNDRTYKGADLMRVGEALSNLEGVDGGPDIAFRPRFKPNRTHIEWVMVTGDPQLTQTGADHVWDTSVPGSSVKGTRLERDGTVIVSDDYESGRNTTGDQIMAAASRAPGDYPVMEASGRHNTVSDTTTLQAYADAAIVRGASVLETLVFSARKTATPALGNVSAGDYCRIVTAKDSPAKPVAGRHRVLSLEADETDWVQYTCTPEQGAYLVPSSDEAYLSDRFTALGRRIEDSNRRN